MALSKSEAARVLAVVTSQSKLGETGRSTGFWMEELAAPCNLFEDAGIAVTIASPLGGKAPVDEGSLSAGFITPDVIRFRESSAAMDRLVRTVPLDTIRDMSGFDALFLVGGHGTMWDFAPNTDLARLLEDAEARGTVVSAVCHGVAGLLNATKSRSVQGRRVTAFSDEEEGAVGLAGVVPFLLETRLKAEGAKVETGTAFQPKVVIDGRLVTGQNPSSSRGVAQDVLKLLHSS
jgi:putative intracellular protease/amidase